MANVLKMLVKALLALGLIVAGFYAKSHGSDPQYLYIGAGILIFNIIMD
jgi:hypothetical protein